MNSPRSKGSCQPKRQNLKTCRAEAPPRRHQSKPNRVEKFWSAFFSSVVLFCYIYLSRLPRPSRPLLGLLMMKRRAGPSATWPGAARRRFSSNLVVPYGARALAIQVFFCWEARQKWGICCLWSRNLINSSSDGSYSRRRGPKWTWWSMWSELEVITCERNIE